MILGREEEGSLPGLCLSKRVGNLCFLALPARKRRQPPYSRPPRCRLISLRLVWYTFNSQISTHVARFIIRVLAMPVPSLSIPFKQMFPSLFWKALGTCSKHTTQTNKLHNLSQTHQQLDTLPNLESHPERLLNCNDILPIKVNRAENGSFFMSAPHHQIGYLRFNGVRFISSDVLPKQAVQGGAEFLPGALG